MASAKILTLAIRTLAKPIATQIKSQAASHERFRQVCIGLAQGLHRTEMAWRSKLLSDGSAKELRVRPLNDAKAVANGANFLSEAFLFAIAAGLILGETYRSNRKEKRRRRGVNEDLVELRAATRLLAQRLGVEVALSEDEDVEAQAESSGRSDPETAFSEGDAMRDGQDDFGEGAASVRGAQNSPVRIATSAVRPPSVEQERLELERLQHAVSVLLRLAIKQHWVEGEQALRLEAILDGHTEASTTTSNPASSPPSSGLQTPPSPPPPQPSPSAPGSPAPVTAAGPDARSDGAELGPTTAAQPQPSPSPPPPSASAILEELARRRARQIADEVRAG